MCSDPVTLGGGITIENTGPGAFTSARKSFSSAQHFAQRCSICCGWYAFGISLGMLPVFQLRTLTIRTPARAVKSVVRMSELDGFRDQEGKGSKPEILMLLGIPIDQLLNDGAQKFLGDDVNDLGTHLIEDSLNDSLDKRWIRRHWRRWVRRCGWAEGCP